jgi:hypothetical protein
MTRRAKTLRGSRRRQGEGPSPRAGLESAACSTGAYGPAAPEGKTPAPPVINGSSREAPSRVHPLKLVTIVRGVLRLASVAALPSIPQGQLPRDFREMGRSCEDWRRESLFREGQLDLRDRARIGQGSSGRLGCAQSGLCLGRARTKVRQTASALMIITANLLFLF